MTETIKTRVKIKEPWEPEFVGYYETLDNKLLIFNMINKETGEIRQKKVSLDYIARHLFKHIQTELNRGREWKI